MTKYYENKSFLWVIFISLKIWSILLSCMSMHCVHTVWLWRLKDIVSFPGIGIIYSCLPSGGCWDLNLSPLNEYQVILIDEQFFYLPLNHFSKNKSSVLWYKDYNKNRILCNILFCVFCAEKTSFKT